ncbi:MAG: competence damage-inducible protein A [Thermoprotei archaeon]|nr:MAG: competence damage-inducible protein A [Thermoprotei archaeon]RLF19098.1 MAG: competence damage-inducible protein A [Thermoprotei archaeon]
MGLAEGYDAWILTIGNEILIGKVVNTNLAWLGRKLTLLGYKVRRGLIVPDDVDEIAWAFRTSLEAGAKVVISTGGLGPTFDDKTAEGLAVALGVKLELNEEALSMVKRKYEERGLELTEHRIKMAKIPRGAKPIPNPIGTAPGIYVIWNNTHIFALPGVPKEMKAMFEEYVEAILRKVGPKIFFVEGSVISRGVPESTIAPIVDEVMRRCNRVYIKSHPRTSEAGEFLVELHVTASSPNREEAKNEIRKAIELLVEKISGIGGEVEIREIST